MTATTTGEDAEHSADFRIRMPFEEAQGEHFGGAPAESGHGAAEDVAEVGLVGGHPGFRRVFERDIPARPKLDQVD